MCVLEVEKTYYFICKNLEGLGHLKPPIFPVVTFILLHQIERIRLLVLIPCLDPAAGVHARPVCTEGTAASPFAAGIPFFPHCCFILIAPFGLSPMLLIRTSSFQPSDCVSGFFLYWGTVERAWPTFLKRSVSGRIHNCYFLQPFVLPSPYSSLFGECVKFSVL
jgi:hypothetical protein